MFAKYILFQFQRIVCQWNNFWDRPEKKSLWIDQFFFSGIYVCAWQHTQYSSQNSNFNSSFFNINIYISSWNGWKIYTNWNQITNFIWIDLNQLTYSLCSNIEIWMEQSKWWRRRKRKSTQNTSFDFNLSLSSLHT